MPVAPRLRAVLFDLDDTLFDHARATRVALSALREIEPALGRWSLDELDRRHRVVLEAWHHEVLAGRATMDRARIARFTELTAAAGGEATEAHASALARRYRAAYETAWYTVDGAVPVLEALVAGGYLVAIITNNLLVEQQLKLARCGLSALVPVLITSEEVGRQKPDPVIFEAALDRLGVSAAESVMVGDAWATDIEGARRAGVRAVWLNRVGDTAPEPTVTELRSFEPFAEAWAAIVGESPTPG
jgi:HAD superfamily hydrolase (TIGR01662 family)